MKTVDVKTSILISLPVKKVAAYAADPLNAPNWYVNIKSAEYLLGEEKVLEVGSQIAFKAQFLGRQLAYTYEITEYVPLQKLVMRTADGPFPMETTYSWKAASEDQTHMHLRNTGRPSGFSGIVTPLMAWAMKRANGKDLERLKNILEKKA